MFKFCFNGGIPGLSSACPVSSILRVGDALGSLTDRAASGAEIQRETRSAGRTSQLRPEWRFGRCEHDGRDKVSC